MAPLRARFLLWVQRGLSHLLFPVIGPAVVGTMRFYGRYRVHDLDEVRRRFAEITRAHPGPLLICGNHLTMADSALAAWALASNVTYIRRFRLLPWNVPDLERYSFKTRALGYLTKCIPIVRDGPQQDKRAVLGKLKYLLANGEAVSIFPEGTRSRNGRLDMENFGYGAGQLATSIEGVTVLCVYLRGTLQSTWSDTPSRNDRFHVEMRVLEPHSDYRGMRAARDVSVQIMGALQEMEQRYFAQTVRSS